MKSLPQNQTFVNLISNFVFENDLSLNYHWPSVYTKTPDRSRLAFNPNPSMTVQLLTNFDGELVVSVHVQHEVAVQPVSSVVHQAVHVS